MISLSHVAAWFSIISGIALLILSVLVGEPSGWPLLPVLVGLNLLRLESRGQP